MSDWRGKAAELLPELAEKSAEADSPMAFWIELFLTFENAYQSPCNEDLIRRVYAFSEWCVQQEDEQEASNHLPTCVVVCFYEHIPTCPPARADMPRWFTRAQVERSKAVFSYLLSEQEFVELLALFPQSPSERKSARKQINRQQQKGKHTRRKQP